MYIKHISRQVIDVLEKGTREQRHYICSLEPIYFAVYYFPEFFTYGIAGFQYEFYEDFKKLISGELDHVGWIAFRESAKTSIAKIMVLWCIVYKKKHYINWDSYDKSNSSSALFDIVIQLQTNRRLIRDYGQLFYKRKHKDALEEAKLKKVTEFITENNIKVEAHSTQESTRGRVFGTKRPDLYILDDIETSKTKKSYPVTIKIIDHLNELKAGLSVDGSVLYLGNYITEDGVIEHVLSGFKGNPKALMRDIPVVDVRGKLTWAEKYVKTNAEAVKINRMIEDRSTHKVSLEAKKRDLGKETFATEMMNDPTKSGDRVFDEARIKQLIEKAKDPIKIIGGFQIWADYNPRHRYAGGGDTAEGIGQDSNADAYIDFTRTPNLLVGHFESNLVDPVMFASHMKKHGDFFGGCFLVPELNQTGYATVAELINLEYFFMYNREVKNKITNRIQKEFGFKTTTGTKHEIIAQFKNAVEDGELEILSLALLKECLKFRLQDLRLLRPIDGMTQHFDLLQAAALAWEGRKHAELGTQNKGSIYKSSQKPYQG